MATREERRWLTVRTLGTLRTLVVATVVLYMALASVGGYFYVSLRDATRQNKSAVTGLCALRHDLVQRVTSSQDFLRQHPKGIPGIPNALIRKGIADQSRTLRALDVVKCKEVP